MEAAEEVKDGLVSGLFADRTELLGGNTAGGSLAEFGTFKMRHFNFKVKQFRV